MLEYEKIQQTDIRTPAIMAFADSLLAAQGVSPQGLSAEDKAMALFREQAAGQLVRMTAARNKALSDYMQSTHGAAAPAFRVQAMDSAAMLTYAGRDRYTIAIEVDGETVEVATEDGAPAARADPAIAMRLTDRSGLIPVIEIPVPNLSESQEPGAEEKPYALVNMYASRNGFGPFESRNIQVFAGTTTFQDIKLIPLSQLPQGKEDSMNVDTPPQNL